MIGNTLENLGDPCLRVDVIGLCGLNQGMGEGGGS